MMKVYFLQVFISTAAIFAVGLISYNFAEKAFSTVRYLAANPFTSSSTYTT